MFVITHINYKNRFYAKQINPNDGWNFAVNINTADKITLKYARAIVYIAKHLYEDGNWVKDIKIQFVQ